MKKRVADLFCGTGGFSYGFALTEEFDVVLGIELLPTSSETFAANHPKARSICGDIRTVNLTSLANQLGGQSGVIDVIIGGPPCQGFSSIRPFRSVNQNDHRNSLFEQFIQHVAFFGPRFVVFENVAGLAHHKNGATLKTVVSAIEGLGYATCVSLLNAMSFGVPQKRERLIVIGRKGKRRPRMPSPTHRIVADNGNAKAKQGRFAFGDDLPPAVTVDEAIGDLPEVAAGESATSYRSDAKPSEYARARRKGQRRLTLHSSTAHTPRMMEIIRHAGKNRWALPEGLTSSGFSSCYSRLDRDAPSTTITVNFVHPASNRCIHPVQDRALTPREGARLQSFDDDFQFCGSRTRIVKQIGEAMPPLLGRALATSLLGQW